MRESGTDLDATDISGTRRSSTDAALSVKFCVGPLTSLLVKSFEGTSSVLRANSSKQQGQESAKESWVHSRNGSEFRV